MHLLSFSVDLFIEKNKKRYIGRKLIFISENPDALNKD